MAAGKDNVDIKSGRLPDAAYVENFSDLHAPLSKHEAAVEADRCYFCYDAPCMTACPTRIDIPMFIRQIAADNPKGSAKTIFEQNIMGGMCARVCPTETLCEEVCVREIAEGKPVKIGLLQRYATDHYMSEVGAQPFERAAETGKKVAVIGAGPAGLSCAHRLAMHGHDITIYEAKQKPGGLNEFGIAAYKSTDDFAAREADFITGIGGIKINYDMTLGEGDLTLQNVADCFDAVFIGAGLPDVNDLGLAGDEAANCIDAVKYIAELRQSDDLSKLPVGRNVVVIGGGMTAIDVATQVKLLGAQSVTICYRRGAEAMGASAYEQDVAQTHGVTIRHWLQPKSLVTNGDKVTAIELEFTSGSNGSLKGTGETLILEADQVFKAIGQSPDASPLGNMNIKLEKGRIAVDEHRKTSHEKIWAGGDCVAGGEDLTVVSVEDGKVAAENIHKALMG